MKASLLAAVLLLTVPAPAPAQAPMSIDQTAAARFASLALDCVHKEYPNKIAHVLNGDADILAPRQLTPAFYGCYDWHSSVHGHWLLARLARTFPEASFTPRAKAALARSLTPENIAAEVKYSRVPAGRASSGPTAWRGSSSWPPNCASGTIPGAGVGGGARAARAGGRRAPEGLAAEALAADPHRRARPDGLCVRSRARLGARRRQPRRCCRSSKTARATSTCGTAAAPSTGSRIGQDFLSPCLAEADLMRRVLPPAEYATWLQAFLPGIPHVGCRVVAGTRRRHGPHRSEARAPRRPQPQPRLDARGHRRPASRRRTRGGRRSRQRPSVTARRASRRHGRALRGRPLARQLRRVPDDEAGNRTVSAKCKVQNAKCKVQDAGCQLAACEMDDAA